MTAGGADEPIEHVNVLIVGAGLSGIGAACRLTQQLPGRSVAILEARAVTGGTWDLFRYPGVRSDSDMFTLGYRFRPWQASDALADGPSILSYVRDTAREFGIDTAIRLQHKVVRAEWQSGPASWLVDVQRGDTGQRLQLRCDFLYVCSGYYRYDEGYTPDLPGRELFGGRVVHPQHWPAELEVRGRRVVVIGSGATAVTLVPALAREGAHVTMLQRSPSYILSIPARDPIAAALHRLPTRVSYPIIRWKNVLTSSLIYRLSQRFPTFMKRLIRKGVSAQLPAGYPVDTDFAPTYGPWDQRLCLVPDGDLFAAIRDGAADVVTGQVQGFTEAGVRLTSGRELPADIVVTATGLNLLLLGGIEVVVDGAPVHFPDTVGYKGIMFSGVPNLAVTIGYTNASWTLKADLTADYVIRLLRHLDEHGYRACTPRRPSTAQPTQPFINLQSGYVQRSAALLPRQGSRTPWRLHQNYLRDIALLRYGRIDDGALEFSSAAPARSDAAVG